MKRYSFRIIHHRKALGVSLFVTGLILALIFVFGFTFLDAKQFFFGFLESLTRVTVAYFISLFLAFLLAMVATASKSIEEGALPILDALQSIPSFALFPLFVIWFGKTAIITVVILIIEMIWPILFAILSSKKQIREDLVEAAHVFGADRFKFFSFVLVPLLFPSIVTGSLVAWGEAWEAIIAAEILVDVGGVGSYLAHLGQIGSQKVLLIGIALLLMILFILNKYIWIPLLNSSTKYQQES